MKKLILTTMALLMYVSSVSAEGHIAINDVTIEKRGTATISFELINPDDDYSGVQFLLELADGLSLETNNKGKINFIRGSRLDREDDYTISGSNKGNNQYQILSYYSDVWTIPEKSGVLFSVTLQADESISNGDIMCKISDIKLSTTNAQKHTPADVSFTVTVTGMTVTAKDYTRKYGEDNPDFGYDVEGGTLSGTPSISCAATATSPVGTYPIVISQGSVTNGGVEYVNGTLTIEKAPLTISGGSYTKKQGDPLPTLSPVFTGFKNGETSTVLTTQPTITTTATVSSEPGNYPVTVSGAAAENYDISYEDGTLTVTDADPVTVTAQSYTIKYGDALPTFNYTSTGATLNGTPTVTCEATSTSPVGTYDIVITKGSISNYNVSYVPGTLTIEPAPLTITANNATKKQGEANPAFTATYSGFKNGETESVLTTQPTFSTDATVSSVPGNYTITPSGAAAQNYTISYVNGTLTVTDADPVTVTAQSYTIKYGDPMPTFNFTSTGATLSGTPTITCEATSTSGVGTYPIVITKGSISNYNDSYVPGTLTIEPAPLTITANNATKKQGEANPAFTATYSGFKNGETESVLTTQPTFSTDATVSSVPGNYTITPSGAAAQNYTISYVNGTLTVTDADPVTVTAQSYTIKYGDALPTFNYTSTGATLSGTPTITCEATNTSGVGTYPIVITKGSISNYNVSYVNGTLTIDPAPLTIKPNDVSRKQGEANPTFTATYTGFKNGENESVLTTQPTITTTATPSSAVGEYDITASGAEAQNYAISYQKGTLTVVDADATVIKARSYTIEYGDAIPTFAYDVEGAAITGTPKITCTASPTSPAGTYVITIEKGTVTNYNDHYVNGTLTIEKAPLTIKAGNYEKKQGEQNPTFTASYEGFKNGETSSVLTSQPTLSTTVTTSTAPGTYAVTVSGAEAQNYTISYVNGTLKVNEADPVTITATNVTRKYGEANPTFEFTSSGATVVGTPSITCAATATSPVGTYDIVITKGSVSNYNDTYVNGTLTIEPTPLTIGGGTYTKKQGEAMPTLTATYSGFKNGETNSVLTTQPTITTTATASSAPGSYPVTVSGAAAQNYTISYVPGTLTVTDADPVTVTAQSYTIKYGDPMPTYGYTSSGATLSGTPTITCEATSTTGVGTYDIVITKGSVSNYNDTYVNGTLTIEPAPLTIKAGNYTMKQGKSLPTFTASYEGFKNGETETVLSTQPTITTTATASSAPGSYPVTVSGAAAQNYTISYVNGTLTVTDADAIVLTAKSYTREYGEANPTLEFTVDAENDITLVGTPQISCTATATTPVGIYPIVITKGSVSNYNDHYVNGTLTIVKAPLTIKAGDYEKKQGEQNPTFTATYEGFKNGETSSVLTSQPTLSTTVTTSTAPGTYAVTVSGAEAQNYNISYVNGTLKVNEADPVTITATNVTRKYGEANPTFEFTSTGATVVGTPSITCAATATSPVGTYDIVITKGSVSNYNDTYVNGTLTIEPAPLTISGGTYTMKEGRNLPTFTASYEGFKNGETSSVLTTQPTLTTTATSASTPGSYEVTVAGASAQNYVITYVSGTLTILEEGSSVVTVQNYSRYYGDANPVFEYTVEGEPLEGTPVVSCEATATSSVGTYPISITKGTVQNTKVTYVAGTLTVLKAPLTIKAGNYSMTEGNALPTLRPSYTGFKNGETSAVLTTQPTITTTATSSSKPGTYPVTVSGAAADNYAITYQNGTLTVYEEVDDEVEVIALDCDRVYGEPNPEFSYKVEGAVPLDGQPLIECNATETSPVGKYQIMISKGTVTNIHDSYTWGWLTITPAPLTISAGSYTMVKGEPLPEFVATYEGFKNNENELVLTKKPVFSTDVTSLSDVGTYELSIGGAEAKNYTISYVAGEVTVTASTGIDELTIDNGRAVNIYNMQGKLVREHATTLKGLPRGVYVVNGRKVVIAK